MTLRVNIDYGDERAVSAPGVSVTRDGVRLISWNTGKPAEDWSSFIDWSFECGEAVTYGTSITGSEMLAGLTSRAED